MSAQETAGVPQSAMQHVPYLRRHARMLLGRQGDADRFVTLALDSLNDEGRLDSALDDLQVAMFQALYDALNPELYGGNDVSIASGPEILADARLRALSPRHRSVLLLTTVEGLSDQAVGAVLDRSTQEIAALRDQAQILLERELRTSVLIIEDEWLIARDLRRIVGELGHEVSSIAATRTDAVEAARRNPPGLVLADINLADGSSGVDAVRDIFEEDGATPTIFITAFPEILLTGLRPEPTYLIAKPYSPAVIQAVVSQALFFSDRNG